MARIRSVHPGLFTDEAFVSLSDAAQILYVGLLTECDDQGAFEWKPVQIRIKLRAGKDGSVDPLLEELSAANCIRSYEHEGRKYGLVRNFCKYQRPKKPNSIYFIPTEFRTYLGSRRDGTEPQKVKQPSVPHQFPTGGEKSPQMEDGGWRMEDGVESPSKSPSAKKPQREKRATGVSDDFTPKPEIFLDPSFDPLTEEERRAELPRFIDYWKGTGGKKVDWNATFRNRLRDLSDWKKQKGNSNGRTSVIKRDALADAFDFNDDLLARREARAADEDAA